MGLGELVAELTKLAEAGACFRFRDVERSDGHEALGFEVGEVGEAFEQGGELGGVGSEAGFGCLGAELDFKQDRERLAWAKDGFRAGGVKALREADGVEGVDGVEDFDGVGDLVGLQVADEVDLDLAAGGGGMAGGGA